MQPKTQQNPESIVREIKRNTRHKFNSEENIPIILEGLKGEDIIANTCRQKGIALGMYYKWSKAFLEAGKRKLNGDTMREATSDEVIGLRQKNECNSSFCIDNCREKTSKLPCFYLSLRCYMVLTEWNKITLIAKDRVINGPALFVNILW